MSIDRSAEQTVVLVKAQQGTQSSRIKTWAEVKGEKVGAYRMFSWAEIYTLRALHKEG